MKHRVVKHIFNANIRKKKKRKERKRLSLFSHKTKRGFVRCQVIEVNDGINKTLFNINSLCFFHLVK